MRTVRLLDAVTGDAAGDLDLGVTLLRSVPDAPGTRWLRTYRPQPTAAFSRRETRLPGFDAAVSAAAASGYAPLVRPTGGRAVVYDAGSVVVDVVEPADGADHRTVYARIAGAIAGALRELGVDAAVGEVPGEYCPGDYSIGARGVVKLAGVAQRATRAGRLVSVVLSALPSPPAVELLTEVNDELGFAWRPETYGSVAEELGAAPPADLEDRLCAAIAPEGEERHRWTGSTALHG